MISSKSNDKIKYAVRLRDSAQFRRETGEFFIEGARLCADAAESVGVKTVFYTAQAEEKFSFYLERIFERAEEKQPISGECAAKLGGTVSPQGVFCICPALDKNVYIDKIYNSRRLILLENVQDPSNLGAIARTAEALGIGGAVLSGCCDAYNPKALRASMGSLLRLPLCFTDDLPAFLADLRGEGFLCLASTPSDSAADVTEISLPDKAACVIGNEGSGITGGVFAACDMAVRVPMKGRAESLNASMAAAIIMWELMR